MKKPELLAPVGNLGTLKAAVASGADAVYLGMQRFGARAYAANFNKEYLKKALHICKSNNTKLCLTMNTLIKNSEVKDFFKQLTFAYLSGIDAVIIQDPSFIDIIKKSYPGLRVHISTQSGVMNSESADLLKSADRINLAREVSKENLIDIREKFGKELEIFVHGALCVCVSGQCLFSSFLGGRSGNRGRCAQPCRKLYGKEYYLSTKELCLIGRINELKRIGIDSLKIEGRMRTPYYVATVVSIYRKAIDDGSFKISKSILDKLKTAYSREFTEGRYSSENVFNREKAQGESKVKIKEYKVYVRDISFGRKGHLFVLPEISLKEPKQKKLLVRVYSKEDALLADQNGADIIYLDMFNKDFDYVKNKVKARLYAVTPRIMFDPDLQEIKRRIEEINPCGLLAGNIGILNMGFKIPIHLDYNLNCFNDFCLKYFENLGGFPILSPELSIQEQREFKNKNFAVLVHGKIRLMTLAHNLDKKEITDEKGFNFFINNIKNGSEILNEKELGLFNKAKNLLKFGINYFFIDTEEDVGNVVSLYRKILDGKTVDVSKIRQKYVLGWSQKGIL